MSGRVVQYGRRSSAKRLKSPSLSPEPSPKRQKLLDVTDDDDDDDDDDEPRKPSKALRKTSIDDTTRKGKRGQSDAQTRSKQTANASASRPIRTYSRGQPSSSRPESPPLIPTRSNTPVSSPSPDSNSRSNHNTPSSKPKDLSGIFAPLPQLPASPSSSPGKSVTKRMLVRSHTQPSSPSSSTSFASLKSTLTVSASLPTVSAPSFQPEEAPLSPPSPSPFTSKPNFRTYSQSRSFLVPLPAAAELSVDKTLLGPPQDQKFDPDDEVRESYTDLRTRWGVDNSEDDPYHVPGITNELMSITELRSKGESRRFLDEVGYLFEGLEEQGMTASVRRSSAVEIVLKMCDAEFIRKAKAADFIARAWDAMRQAKAGDGDKVLDSCLVFFVALVARDKRDINDLARRDGFFEALTRLLETQPDSDPLLPLDDASARRLRVYKAERVALTNLRNIITNKSNLFATTSLPSTRLLVSYALSAMEPAPLPAQLLSPLLRSLLADLMLLRPRIDAYVSGLPLLPQEALDNPDIEHIDNCLRVFDSFLLGAWGRTHERDRIDEERETLCVGLVTLCMAATVLELDVERRPLARQCVESSFRVLINLSHTSPEWCTTLLGNKSTLPAIIPHILSQTLIKHEDPDSEGDENRALDRQCLALALLTNIVFGADEARDLIRETNLDPSCPRGRRCVRSCQCTERINAIEAIVHLFKMEPILDSPSAADHEFFRCHLAALLCLLTADCPANQRIVWQVLPGTGAPDKFGGLSHSVEHFLEFYTETGSGADAQGVESAVARRVVLALEALLE